MPRSIGIIGGGFTGALLALHLLRRCDDQDRIFLIEKARALRRRPRLFDRQCASPAERARRQYERLLGRARSLRRTGCGACPTRPGHDRRRPAGSVQLRAARAVRCLCAASLAEAIWRGQRGDRLTIVNDEAVGVEREIGGIALKLAVGRKLVVDTAVARGRQFPPARTAGPVFGDPWDERALADLDPASTGADPRHRPAPWSTP